MSGVIFPPLGYATEEGTVLRWEKALGEAVKAGEPLVEIAAEKAIHVVAASVDGTLVAIYAPPGAIVPEGETLGWVGNQNEAPPALQCNFLGWADDVAPPPPELASQLKPPGTSIKPANVLVAEKPSKAERAYVKSHLREVTAKRMARSWVEAPKVDLFAEVDFTRVVAHREAQKKAGAPASPYNIYITEAVVKAFEEFPELNCHWRDGQRVPLDEIHVGVAVALDESLLTISLKNLGGQSLQDIEVQFRSLLRKAVAMNLQSDNLFGSSMTVTNLGEFEIFGFTPVINPPEVYILGIGELKERPVVREGRIEIAPVCYFCLSFDHRGVDGAPASRLLRAIKHHLEHYPDPQ